MPAEPRSLSCKCYDKVRSQNQAALAEITSALFVQTKGLGSEFVDAKYRSIASSNSAVLR